MPDWWTYRLSDFLLFSPRTYHRLFELYNAEVWPAHIVALAAGGAVVWLVRRGGAGQGRAVAALLAAAWLWVAWAYHHQRYATINWAAAYSAAGFTAEAALLAWVGLVRNRLRFRSDGFGLWLFLFALAVQPLSGPLLAGRPWTQIEIFGIAPDPTAVATLGVLLLAAGRVRWELLAVPLLWCAIGGLTLWTMDAPDAFVTPLAAAAVPFAVWRSRSRPRTRA